MRHLSLILFFSSLAFLVTAQQKETSLEQCIQLARENNIHIRQMKQSLQTREYRLQAAKLSRLPDLDVLGGYTYQSDPVKINLQSVKEGIVKGTAQQNVDAASRVYHEITGNDLSQPAKDAIYGGAADIINNIYPDYNPELSKQQYFTAGLALRMPVYLGGKLNAAQKLAKERLHSGQLNIDFTENTVSFTIVSQYLKILYLNALTEKQRQLAATFKNTQEYARSLVKNGIIPPYQAHWANVAWTQTQATLKSFVLEKENALLSLQQLLGTDSTFELSITGKLPLVAAPLIAATGHSPQQNPELQWLQSKTAVAKVSEKVARSMSYPNIFGIANYQFLRKDLPLITPPWMVGIGLQWNIFSGIENTKNIRAAQSLTKESYLLVQEKKEALQWKIRIIQNKLASLRAQVSSLDQARKEAARTTGMIRKRLKNQMSSVKDVNDALKVQLEAEKAYYSTVLAYDLAVAAYLNILGRPEEMTTYINNV